MRMYGLKKPPTTRAGLASLEFVMVLPILMLMAALIFKIGDGFLVKSHTTITARQNATLRGTPKEEAAPLPVNPAIIQALQPKQDSYGLVSQMEENQLKLRPVFPSTARLRGWHTLLKGSWDHRSVEFVERDVLDPYDARALRMAAIGGMPSLLARLDTNVTNPANTQMLLEQIARAMLEANPGYQQLNQISSLIRNPATLLTAAGDLLQLLTSPRDLAKALESLPKGIDGIEQMGRLISKMRDAAQLTQGQLPDDL